MEFSAPSDDDENSYSFREVDFRNTLGKARRSEYVPWICFPFTIRYHEMWKTVRRTVFGFLFDSAVLVGCYIAGRSFYTNAWFNGISVRVSRSRPLCKTDLIS